MLLACLMKVSRLWSDSNTWAKTNIWLLLHSIQIRMLRSVIALLISNDTESDWVQYPDNWLWSCLYFSTITQMTLVHMINNLWNKFKNVRKDWAWYLNRIPQNDVFITYPVNLQQTLFNLNLWILYDREFWESCTKITFLNSED